VGLGLGIAALRRIRRTGAGGRGVAIAGVVVGAVGTLVLVGIIGFAIWAYSMYQSSPEFREAFDEAYAGESGESFDSGSDTGSGTGSDSGTATVADPYFSLRTDLAVGTCIEAYPSEYDMSDAVLVDCAAPHDTEVVGTVQLDVPVTTDPDDAEYAAAVERCYTQIETAAPGLLDVDGFADVYAPHPDDFALPGGDAGWCVFVSDGESLTGSIAGGDLSIDGQVTAS